MQCLGTHVQIVQIVWTMLNAIHFALANLELIQDEPQNYSSARCNHKLA